MTPFWTSVSLFLDVGSSLVNLNGFSGDSSHIRSRCDPFAWSPDFIKGKDDLLPDNRSHLTFLCLGRDGVQSGIGGNLRRGWLTRPSHVRVIRSGKQNTRIHRESEGKTRCRVQVGQRRRSSTRPVLDRYHTSKGMLIQATPSLQRLILVPGTLRCCRVRHRCNFHFRQFLARGSAKFFRQGSQTVLRQTHHSTYTLSSPHQDIVRGVTSLWLPAIRSHA